MPILRRNPRIGTATNDNAAAGQIGEFISSTVLVGSAVSLTTGTTADVTSISLTAGDWDVFGNVAFEPNAATTMSSLTANINTTSATLPARPGDGAISLLQVTFSTGARQVLQAGTRRLSLSATTTVYLLASAAFAINTLAAYGFIGARRVR